MAVEPIIRLTRPDVLKVLSSLYIPSYQSNTGFGKATNEVYALTRSQFLMAQQAQSLLLITTLRQVYPDS